MSDRCQKDILGIGNLCSDKIIIEICKTVMSYAEL